MQYDIPEELIDLGLDSPQKDDTSKSVLEHFKSMSPPVTEHKIVRGDTLSDIAEMYGTTVREIARLNPQIKNINKIRAGDVLDIPGKKRETVPLTGFESPIDYERLTSRALEPSIGDDSIENSTPEELIPLLKALGAAGVVAGAPSILKGLAGAMPRAQGMAGNVTYPAVKGSVPWEGAKTAFGNVRPAEGVNPGAVKAMLAKMQGQRPLNQGGQLPPSPAGSSPFGNKFSGRGPKMPPGEMQALGRGARLPTLGTASGRPFTPDTRISGDISNMLNRQPTLNDLVREGSKPTVSDVPFQELLRRVGYGR